nr:MAG TPA: hypothetical protein [Caudoviricetes sp.]
MALSYGRRLISSVFFYFVVDIRNHPWYHNGVNKLFLMQEEQWIKQLLANWKNTMGLNTPRYCRRT